MNRKLAAALAVVVVLAAAIWFFFLRGGHPQAAQHAPAAGSQHEALPTPKKVEADTPKGPAPPMRFARDDDPAGPLRLEGQVLDENDQPVGGATVWLSSAPPRTGKTESDGGFAFDKLVGRTYSVAARAGDKVGGPVTYTLTATSDPVVVRLRAGAPLTVVVTAEADGDPVAGAQVEVRGLMTQTASTDAKGQAVLHGVDAGWIALSVTASGYAPLHQVASIEQGQHELHVVLQRGAAVSGRVVDDDGKPVAGAHVVARDVASFFQLDDPKKDGAETDAEGRFTLAKVPAGSYRFVATDDTHAPGTSPPVTLDGMTRKDGIEIVLKPAATLSGRVVNADQTAAAYATVRVGPHDLGRMGPEVAGSMRQVVADQDGKFTLRGLPREALRVRAESDAAASKIVDVDLSGGAGPADLVLVLDVTGTIAGTVVDDTSQPVAEAQVTAAPDFLGGGGKLEDMALAGFSAATTDGGGRFALHGLPPGAYRLWAHRGGGGVQAFTREGTPAKPGDTQVRIVLPAPGSIKGTIALDDGSPVKAAMIRVGWQPGVAAQDGKFVLKDLSPGKYDLRFVGPEFAEFTKADVEVEAGKATDLGTITVKRGRRVTGTVVSGDGTPVAGARVTLGKFVISSGKETGKMAGASPEQMGMRIATTGDDGGFAIVGVGPAEATVVAEQDQMGRSDGVTIPPGTTDPQPIRLRLRGFGSLTGKVTSGGEPVASATILASDEGAGQQAIVVTSGADGAYLVDRIPEGKHRLNVMKTSGFGAASTSAEVTIVAGQRTTANIDMPVGDVTLTVQIQGLNGAVVNAAQVFLFAGHVAARTGQDIQNLFVKSGTARGMKIWLGADFPSFDKVVPGMYTVCTIPITGSLSDPQLMQRLQANGATLKVYCAAHDVPASPKQQTFVHKVPAMEPLPPPQ